MFSPRFLRIFSTRSAKNCGENAELRKGCGDLRYGGLVRQPPQRVLKPKKLKICTLVDPKILRRLYYKVAILPLLLHEVITRYLLWICQVLSCLCGSPLQTIGSGRRHHANRDLLLYILNPSSFNTSAAIETSPVRIFWVSAKSLWSGTADTLSVCCIAVNTFGLPGWVGVDLDSWLPAAWSQLARHWSPPRLPSQEVCPDPVSHCQHQSGSSH